MRRTVAAHLEADVRTPVELVLTVAVATGPELEGESLVVRVDGADVDVVEVADEHGTRRHVAATLPAGRLVVDYTADAVSLAPPAPVVPVDLLRYVRPSRYCESDRLGAVARAEFGGLRPRDALDAVTDWVGARIGYVPGSSRGTDGAVATLLAGEGVCRDFAHLVVAFLRACDVPARLAAVYAPGLSPMDFHAVAEAYVDGGWHAVDATRLAPRSSLTRIATGRDAADTAFLSTGGGELVLTDLEVMAYTDGDLPIDDRAALTPLR